MRELARCGACLYSGGLSVLGSAILAGTEDGKVTKSPVPLRLVRVSPFYMDETELTVGRARPLLERVLGEQPVRKGPTGLSGSEYCTLSDDPSADQLPLNCVANETASELCVLAGGALPTEAEWNHAATGRGQARRFPWGERDNGCCNASISRLSRIIPKEQLCPGEGAEPVGSHRSSPACNGVGDVSRDGVLDLGGSLTEILADRAARLDDPCWGPRFGVLVDPVCSTSSVTEVGTRGAGWSSGSLTAMSAIRSASARSPTRGVRCVYRSEAR